MQQHAGEQELASGQAIQVMLRLQQAVCCSALPVQSVCAHWRDLPGIWGHGVGGQHPTALPQLVCQVKLGVLARLRLPILVHCLGQAESHQGQGVVFAQNPEVPCGHTKR